MIVANDCVIYYVSGFSTADTALAIIGRASGVMNLSGIYLYAAELFPTEVRNNGMGIASTSSRISSMFAPFMGVPLVSACHSYKGRNACNSMPLLMGVSLVNPKVRNDMQSIKMLFCKTAA